MLFKVVGVTATSQSSDHAYEPAGSFDEAVTFARQAYKAYKMLRKHKLCNFVVQYRVLDDNDRIVYTIGPI